MTPPRHDHEHHDAHDNAIDESAGVPNDHPFFTYANDFAALEEGDDDGDDKDRERKREFIKKLVTAILKYHVSPDKLLFSELQDKQTIATALNQTKDVGVPFRIRASPRLDLLPPPPRYDVALNFYAKIRRGPALLAKNGIIHLVSVMEAALNHTKDHNRTDFFYALRHLVGICTTSASLDSARSATRLPDSILRTHERNPADRARRRSRSMATPPQRR